MFKMRNILWFCFTLAVLFAGTADTRADIIIDTFEDGDQIVASIVGVHPVSSEVQTTSGIGGWRFMEATGAPARVEGGVATDIGPVLLSDLLPPVPGGDDARHTTVWNGEGDAGLGGIDLTAGGDAFKVDVLSVDVNDGGLNNLILRVTDTMGRESSESRQWQDLDAIGLNLFPFSSFGGDADFASVDAITLELTHLLPNAPINISDIRVVPEPSSALLLGSSLLGLIGIVRVRRKRAV